VLRVPGPKRRPSDGLFLCKALIDDDRFRALDGRHRYVLLVAAVVFANANGEFYPSKRTWATVAKVGESSVDRAVLAAERVELLTRRASTRANGSSSSNVYAFAASVLNAAHEIGGERVADKDDEVRS
jgi:hypothetical protein